MSSYLFEYKCFMYAFHIPHYRNLFNGQEADNEVYGNGAILGYEFRQYDTRIGRWWSVDPMSDKYPGVGPYVFCNGSPIMLMDPNGKELWIPEVDSKGDVTYTAEKGDNHDTFVRQFDTQGKSRDIFKNAGLGISMGDVKTGDVIKGDAVKKATGNEVLKGNWGYMTKRQKAAQLIFAVNHSIRHGNESGSFDFKNYASNFETYSGEQLSNFYLPTKNGTVKVRNLSIWFTKSNTRAYNRPMISQSYGDWINKYDFRFPIPGSKRSMFMFSIDNQHNEAFQTLFIK